MTQSPPSSWLVYVLLCQDGSFYTGITNNLSKRFLAHQAGKGGHYTHSHRPISVLYQEDQVDKSAALKREHEIKSWTRAEKIRRLHLSTSDESGS